MAKHNAENERIKRAYLSYLKEARGLSDASIDSVAAAIARFEDYTNHRNFKSFHINQAIAFKRNLAEQVNEHTGQRLSKTTLHSMLRSLRAFFLWLAGQSGYRSRIAYADADYFSLSDKEVAVAKAARQRVVPTVEQILYVLKSMPVLNEVDLRNRALVAFTLLTGARDGALASLKLKHVDHIEGKLFLDAREVNTKFSKTFTTWFFPVPGQVQALVVEWVEFLTRERLFGPSDPLFPATRISHDESHSFRAEGLSREHWSNAGPIRGIFKKAFESAGLPYANPHSFRSTLAQLGERLCQTPEEFKAWSQNLGHEKVMTTFSSYGQVQPSRQRELIRQLALPAEEVVNTEMLVSQIRRALLAAR